MQETKARLLADRHLKADVSQEFLKQIKGEYEANGHGQCPCYGALPEDCIWHLASGIG